MKLMAQILIILGLTLLAFGAWLNGGSVKRTPSTALVIDLPRRQYRCKNRTPGRWEVIMAGFSIMFKSVAFAAVGA